MEICSLKVRFDQWLAFFQHFYKLCFDVLRSFPTNWASNLTHDSGTFRAAPCLVCYRYGSFVCSVIANALSPCSRDLSLAYPTRYHVPGLKLEVRHLSTFQTFILLFFAGIFEGRAWNRLTLWLKLPNQGFMTYDVWGVLNLLFIWGQTSQQLSITNSYSSKFSNVKSLKHACHFYFFLLFSKILWFFFHRSFKAYFKVNLDIYQPHWFTFLCRVMELIKKNVNHPPKSVFPIVCWIKGHY